MRGGASEPGVSVVSLGGHRSSILLLAVAGGIAHGRVQASLRARRFGGIGGQDGLGRIGWPSSAARSAGQSHAFATNDTGSSGPRTLPGAFSRRGGGTACLGLFWAPQVAAIGALDGDVSDQWKSVPSTHMRCSTTASLRASATFAAFRLRRLAICIAQALSDDHRP